LFFWLPVLSLTAQNIQIDSLKMILQSGQSAKETTKTLVELYWEYRFINADTARQYGMKALVLKAQAEYAKVKGLLGCLLLMIHRIVLDGLKQRATRRTAFRA